MKPVNSIITGTLFASALVLSAATAIADQHDAEAEADQKDTTIEHDTATDDQNNLGDQQGSTEDEREAPTEEQGPALDQQEVVADEAEADTDEQEPAVDEEDATADATEAAADEQESAVDEREAGTDERDMNTSDMSMEATFITSMEMDALLGKELMGKNVQSTVEDDKSIGTIGDLLLNEEGEISAVIVSVGGFLGMGQKDVAIAWDSLELTQEGDEYIVKVNASQDALENAPELEVD